VRSLFPCIALALLFLFAALPAMAADPAVDAVAWTARGNECIT
jgi:hypothetical protein